MTKQEAKQRLANRNNKEKEKDNKTIIPHIANTKR